MITIDYEKLDREFLSEEALEVAVDAATNANHAGMDAGECLEHGIKAYILALEALGWTVTKE